MDLSSLPVIVLETAALANALCAWCVFLQGTSVLPCAGITSVACSIIKHGGARSSILSLQTVEILLLCQRLCIQLVTCPVPGKLNFVADTLSCPHIVFHTYWTLIPALLSPCGVMCSVACQLFATHCNIRFFVSVNPVSDPAVWTVDTLSVIWDGLLASTFPPFLLVARILHGVCQDRPTMFLVAPWWSAQPWFPICGSFVLCRPFRFQSASGTSCFRAATFRMPVSRFSTFRLAPCVRQCEL